MTNQSNNEQRVDFGLKLGYGVGDAGMNLLWVSTSVYLLFYYTDILEISPAVAGSIIFFAMLWDGVTDPLMGFIAERTRTRFGKYRPYLLFGCVPLAVSFVAMFWAQPGSANLVLYVCATHLVFRTLYTVVSVPYSSLAISITSSSKERNSIASVRMVFALLSGFIVAKYTRVAAAHLGNGDEAAGFPIVAIGFGIVSIVILLVTFVSTREEVIQRNSKSMEVSPLEQIKSIGENRSFWVLIGLILTGYTAFQLFAKSMQYYIVYSLSGSREDVGNTLAVLIAIMALLTPAWAWVANKTTKRTVWFIGITIASVGFLTGIVFNTETILQYQIQVGFIALGLSVIPLSFWSMAPDTTEYGEWRTGKRCEASIIGLVSLTQKISVGVGVGATGILLEHFGYQPNIEQTESVQIGIHLLAYAIPCLLLIASILISVCYPITPVLHSKIVEELKSRNSETEPCN